MPVGGMGFKGAGIGFSPWATGPSVEFAQEYGYRKKGGFFRGLVRGIGKVFDVIAKGVAWSMRAGSVILSSTAAYLKTQPWYLGLMGLGAVAWWMWAGQSLPILRFAMRGGAAAALARQIPAP